MSKSKATSKRMGKAHSQQRVVMPTDTQMLDWVGKWVSDIGTLKRKGCVVEIEHYYPDGDNLTSAKGKSVVDAFRNAVVKAMMSSNEKWA